MTREYRYRPPILFLLLGLGGLYVSYTLLRAIGYGEIGFQLLVGFFGLSCLALAIYFLLKFIDKIGSGDLKITDDFIEIPGQWRKRVTVSFTDIESVSKIDTFDKVIEILSKNGLHSIDGKLMDRNDFLELKKILTKYKTEHKPPST
jgi:hypothetical protein